MKITSPAFTENANIPKICSKLGGNQRPPLKIDGVPAETTEITSESLPAGVVEGMISWGCPGWGGPQPPFGTHRYQFYVYALDATLDLPSGTKPKELIATLTLHIIDQDVLTGRFGMLDILRRR